MKVYTCCGIESVTKKLYCQKCGQEMTEEREVSGKGTIFSYTVIHVPPAEYAHLAPYTVALIQLDEAKAYVTARLTEELPIGTPVELAAMEDGAYIYQALSTVH